jgi:hypothetical protein
MRCPLYPQKRTLLSAIAMSALCQKRTLRSCGTLSRLLSEPPGLIGIPSDKRKAPTSHQSRPKLVAPSSRSGACRTPGGNP